MERPRWGQRIKALREKRGFTQEYVANKIGVSESHLSGMEHGRYQSLNDEYRIALAAAFEMTDADFARYIYGGSEPADLPKTNRTEPPNAIPIYTDFPFHAGSPTQPIPENTLAFWLAVYWRAIKKLPAPVTARGVNPLLFLEKY
jgi:transcriptional regulator with XRE-family HTH domain